MGRQTTHWVWVWASTLASSSTVSSVSHTPPRHGPPLAPSAPSPTAKNVVFMVMDDARPAQRYAYNQTDVFTPNMDRLAQGGTVFRHAYSQIAVCGPSRNSFMTGRRPDTTRVWNFMTNFRNAPNGSAWVSLPQYFKQHGYTTLGAGKLFHTLCAPKAWSCDECTVSSTENQPPDQDEPYSWSPDRPYPFPCQEYCQPQPGAPDGGRYAGPVACGDDGPLTNFGDYNSTQLAISNLRYAASLKSPFFIGMGVFKPHYPWHVPQRFVDMYADVNVSVPAHPLFPTGVPPWAADHGLDGLTTFEILNASAPGGLARVTPVTVNSTQPMEAWVYHAMRRGYYSAMSWTDSLIGMMLDEIDALGLTNETLVVLTSDHGYHLGELSLWAKQTLYEDATRVPLTIRAPWIAASVGQHTESFFELVDLYATLADLAGLAPPPDLDGTSQAAAVRNPRTTPPIKTSAFSQFPRCGPPGGPAHCTSRPASEFEIMGISVRTPSARYTEWWPWDGTALAIDWNASASDVGTELYLHAGDTGTGPGVFDAWESVNVVDDPSQHGLVTQLAAMLHTQFRKPHR
eukprot:m.214716 g.214716  ORF g.214716 m.214716 type:complete len:571 (+) comp27313_c0_seq1:98-1810(+)